MPHKSLLLTLVTLTSLHAAVIGTSKTAEFILTAGARRLPGVEQASHLKHP